MEELFGPPWRLAEIGTPAGMLRQGLCLTFPGDRRLYYNRHFSHGHGSYSVGLRPDFTVHLPGTGTISLDAKFRFTLASLDVDDPEDEPERLPGTDPPGA